MTVDCEKDLNSPRFMLCGFLSNMNNTLTMVRTNKQELVFTAITALWCSSVWAATGRAWATIGAAC
jgi:hypothetical protein